MRKKILSLILAALGATLLTIPAAASAQEIHLEGITSFTGTAGAGTLAASGEPTITCESADITNGVVNSGGTTGSLGLDSTGCHTSVFGLTAKCRTTGSALDNTILSSGVFHLITEKQGGNGVAAILVTPNITTLVCAGLSSIAIGGNVIGTITSPACGVESKTLTASFAATGSTQNHLEYTGVKYDSMVQTSGGSQITAGLTSTATLSFASAGKVNCT